MLFESEMYHLYVDDVQLCISFDKPLIIIHMILPAPLSCFIFSCFQLIAVLDGCKQNGSLLIKSEHLKKFLCCHKPYGAVFSLNVGLRWCSANRLLNNCQNKLAWLQCFYQIYLYLKTFYMNKECDTRFLR